MEPRPDASSPDAPKARTPWWRKLLVRASRTILLLVVCLIGMILLFENRFIYAPARYPDGDWDAAARSDPPVEDVSLQAVDGTRLHAWFAHGENASVTILYFHGNAGNLSHRVHWIRALTRLPADVLALDYRGYGKSDGSPTETGIYQDADAAYRYLVETRRVDPKSLIIYGKSLGGGPACDLAVRSPCGALVVQSSFTSIPDMARRLIPIFPAHWFVRTRFDNLKKVKRITAPKLFIHGRGDRLIPYRMAERLYEAAAEPKRIALFDGAGHNDLVDRQTAAIQDLFRELIARIDDD